MNTEIKFIYIPVKQKEKPRFSSKDFNDKNVYMKKRYKMSINFLELASILLSTVLYVVIPNCAVSYQNLQSEQVRDIVRSEVLIVVFLEMQVCWDLT
jgi:hypothetical protein